MTMDMPGFHTHTRAEKTGALIQTTNATKLQERALLSSFRVCTLVDPAFPLGASIPLILRCQAILAYIAIFVFISLHARRLFMPFLWLLLHS
jgi:hypothetical protein